MKRDELLELIPAYALDALDDDERAQVEALLAHDTEAQQLLAEYTSITDVLSMAVPAHLPPATMKAGLRQRIAGHDPESQKVTDAGSMPARNSETTSADSFINKEKGSRRFPLWMALVSAAALIVIIIGLGIAFTRPSDMRYPGEILYDSLMAQNDTQRFDITPGAADNVIGELLASADGKEAVLRVGELPQITEDQRYQLWLIDDSGAESAGIFYWATGHGPYYISLPVGENDIRDYVAVGMSIEPEGGSPYPDRPTGDSLFRVRIS